MLIGSSIAERRFTMLLLVAFAAVAVVLAVIGIYGVLAHTSVSARTRLASGSPLATRRRRPESDRKRLSHMVYKSIIARGVFKSVDLTFGSIGFGWTGTSDFRLKSIL